MRTSAQIIHFREQDRRAAQAVELDDVSAARTVDEAESLNACNAELAKLIQELRTHIPNYARI